MELEQQFELSIAPDLVWAAFQDIELLVTCLPGASLTGPAADGELPLRFEVKLGPIAAGFVGTGRVEFDHGARCGRFEGSASDKRTNSRVKGAAHFQLEPQSSEGSVAGVLLAGSTVKVRVDYNLTGSLAQFSRAGIVRELASALTAQFANNLSERLLARTPQDHPVLPERMNQDGGRTDPCAAGYSADQSADQSADHAKAPVGAAIQATAASAVPGTAERPASSLPSNPAPNTLSLGKLLMTLLRTRWQSLWRRRAPRDTA